MKIKELKPTDLNCNVFDVYSYNGLSMQDLLCQFFTKINECIDTSNNTLDLCSWLVNEGLKKEVAEKLLLWYQDGTLEELINTTLFENLNNKINDALSEIDKLNEKVGDIYNIKMFGAVGDDDKDDTEAFKNAIEHLKSLKSLSPCLVLNAGKYVISSSIKIPLYIKLVTDGNVEIRYTGQNELFHFYNEVSIQGDLAQNGLNLGNILDGSKGSLIIRGLGKTEKQTAIKLGEDIMNTMHVTHTAWFNMTNVYIEKFGVGIYFTNVQNFMQRFYNIVISHCDKTISNSGKEPSNSGELITFNSCAFLNSTIGVEINNIINFNFDNCSIDYNRDGIVLNYGGYYELNLNNCWLEGNDYTYKDNYLLKSNATQSSLTTVNINNCFIYPKDRIPSKQIVGKMLLNLNNNTLQCNRYTQGNYPEGEFICGDDVTINSFNGFNFTDNVMLTSSNEHINSNWNFSDSVVGESSTKGFEFVSAVGSSTVTVSNERYYTSNKSLKISSNGTYKQIKTNKFKVSKYNHILGDVLIYLADNNGSNNGLNITTTIKFYDAGDNEVHKLEYNQNFSYTIDKLNKWFSIPQGINKGSKPIKVPFNAEKCDVSLSFGNIKTDFFIDNFIITGY